MSPINRQNSYEERVLRSSSVVVDCIVRYHRWTVAALVGDQPTAASTLLTHSFNCRQVSEENYQFIIPLFILFSAVTNRVFINYTRKFCRSTLGGQNLVLLVRVMRLECSLVKYWTRQLNWQSNGGYSALKLDVQLCWHGIWNFAWFNFRAIGQRKCGSMKSIFWT